MIQATQTIALPKLPSEVTSFADEQSAGGYLTAVITMTRRIFPHPTINVRLEGDPEIANDWHIALEVDVTGMDTAEMVASQNRWSTELFHHCPATHAHLFRIAMI